MRQALHSLLLLLFTITACKFKQKQTLQEKQKELDIGRLDERYVYSAKEIGWSVQLPSDWRVIGKRENFETSKKGQKFIEESIGTKIDASGIINLISLRKDQYNAFESIIDRYDDSTDDSYDDHNRMVHDILKQTHKAKEIYAEYELGATRIDGVMLDRFCIKIYSSDKRKVILEQKIFSGLINGYDFRMIISYNNKSDGETLMNIINSSTFSIKK